MVDVDARPTSADRLRAALWFAEHGFGVFPVWSTGVAGACRCPAGRACENAGKHPSTTNGFRDATTDAARIATMLSVPHDPNYGLVCPDGVFVLDVDGDGVERLAGLEREHGALPPTLRTRTANGWHVFLRWPTDYPRPIGQLWGFVTRWGSGRDAGYVIGPRSVHRSGVAYAPDGVFEIAELPDVWARSVVDARPAADEDFILVDQAGYELPDFGYTGERYGAVLRYVASRYKRGLSQDEIWAGVRDVLAPRFEHALAEPELRSRFERAWKRTPERMGPPDPTIETFTSEELAAATPIATAAVPWPDAPDQLVYHGVVGDIVRAVAPVTEADPVGILASLLTIAGGCMGRWSALFQGSNHGPNIFTVLVGDSSVGRKGTAGSIAREVMGLAYPEWQKLIVSGLGSGEGLVGHLKAVEQTEHRAIVLESEFGRLLTVMAREGSTLSPIVRDAWDGVPMGRFLAREQSLVTWHHVAISAHVTTVELRQKLSNVDAANGFGNRFLWFAVRRTQLVPFPESPKHLVGSYTEALAGAITDAQRPRELRWTDAAADRWEELYASLSGRRRSGLLGAITARAEAQIARLSLLYALLDRAADVDVEHLRAAEALWSYAERSAMHIFGDSTGNRHSDALRDLLSMGPVGWQDAKKDLGLRTSADLREAVDLLVGLGIAEVVSVTRGGTGRRGKAIQLVGTSPITAITAKSAQGSRAEKEANDA